MDEIGAEMNELSVLALKRLIARIEAKEVSVRSFNFERQLVSVDTSGMSLDVPSPVVSFSLELSPTK